MQRVKLEKHTAHGAQQTYSDQQSQSSPLQVETCQKTEDNKLKHYCNTTLRLQFDPVAAIKN